MKTESEEEELFMIPSVRALIESGAHFGHQTSRWNPKMRNFIFGRRNVIHIIDLRMTLKGLIRGSNVLKNIAAMGEQILFVGTKKQARNAVLEEAKRCTMPYVCDRWLGGTLTNFATIRSRLASLIGLEEQEKSGAFEHLSKKESARLLREKRKLIRNLDGIRTMERLPGALVVVDPKKEQIAVREAKILGIPVVAIIDTDSDPDTVDICIPANDDAFRSIKILVSHLTDAVAEGRRVFDEGAALLKRAEVAAAEQVARPPAVEAKARGARAPARRRREESSRGEAARRRAKPTGQKPERTAVPRQAQRPEQSAPAEQEKQKRPQAVQEKKPDEKTDKESQPQSQALTEKKSE
jgi:small subunit ribosomal protein S2